MARLLAILGSGRRHGFTARLLEAAIEGAREMQVEVEMVHLVSYRFSPCNSCFACIRRPEEACVLEDDMGARGELFHSAKEANGLLVADAVHMWGPTAYAHTFMERLYPMIWTGEMKGLPFATISCASNQGMQILATREMCKWALGLGMRYIGGLPVHTAHLEQALPEAKTLGRRLAQAAKIDEAEGRQEFANDEECYLYYMDKPWNALEPYIENLSNGTFKWEMSLPEFGLRQATFERPEAIELLEETSAEFRETLRYYKLNDFRKAIKHLVRAGICWTSATWKEFLERDVVGAAQPKAYRPLSQIEEEDES